MEVLEKLRSASELIDECFTLADVESEDQQVIYVNRAFTRLTGYELGEIAGRNFRILQGPLTSSAAKTRIRKAITDRVAIHQDLVNYKKSGEAFWNRMVLVPCTRQMHLYYFGIQMDVTNLK